MKTLKDYAKSGKDSKGLPESVQAENANLLEESPETTTELGYWDKERKLWVESDIMKSNWESI